MGLYTFFITYENGTQVDQVTADSPAGALESWVAQFHMAALSNSGEIGRQELVEAMEGDQPIPIRGAKLTWCWSALLEDKLLLVHFTETAENGPSENLRTAKE